MRVKGKLTEWHDEKGYGFVEPMASELWADDKDAQKRAFVHIKAFAGLAKRPEIGDMLVYQVRRDARHRVQAVNIAFSNAPVSSARHPDHWPPQQVRIMRRFGVVLVLMLLSVFAYLQLTEQLSWLLPCTMLGFSLVTVLAYAIDKRAARQGHWRTAESTLHLLALAGGWPGALLAQTLFRHKSVKASFQRIFWCSVMLNLTALFWLIFMP